MLWNDKQLKTIETHGKNVLVSAAAGSGKTAVLTERILRMVTERRVPVKELLVVTFTEAAASEMKSRIASALTAASEHDPFAEKQLRQLGSAKIMTFHAFCLTVLKRYYYAIDLDPSFAVADGKRAGAMRDDAAGEVIAAAFNDADERFHEDFTNFLLAYGDVRGEKKVREMILNLYEFIMTLPDPFVWLKNSVDALFMAPEDIGGIPAVRFANAEIAHRLGEARRLAGLLTAMLADRGLTKLAAKSAADQENVRRIEESFLSGDKALTAGLLENLSFVVFRAGNDEKDAYEDVRPLVKFRRDRIKDIVKNDVAGLFLSNTDEEYADEIAHIAPYARTLETLVKRFADTYADMKRSEKEIDFADFEHMALKILEDESIADDYRRRFSSIFIDEYQDSNYVQEALISRISRGGNVFMVGDVKQSIYSFRNAAPEIFLSKQRSFSAGDEEGQADLRIDLSNNYRSKACVVEAVNSVFESIMEGHYSGMVYGEGARLVTGVTYAAEAEGETCLHLIKKDSERGFFGSDAENEAVLCADIINNMIGRDFYDTKRGAWRPLRYCDIAILLRTAKDASDIFRRTLESFGIPAVADRGEGFFKTVEVDTFLALLRTVLNMRRDVPLTASMCSVVFGFSLSELADIRAENPDGFFHTAVLGYAESGSDALLRGKCAAMAEKLAKWRDEERFMRLDDFLWKLMRESGFYEYAGTLKHGALRQANLRALLDRAADFQRGRIDGLRGFLTWLDKLKDRGGAAQATLLTGDEDICRIMTIHGSKGLEFPVVFMCGLGKSLTHSNMGDDSLLYHRDAGLSLQWRDPAAHTYKKTFLHKALKLKQDVVERAEAIRLLYVGMTRAMDTLHMIGTMRDPEKWAGLYENDDASPEADTEIFGASSYLGLLLPTAVKRKDLFSVKIWDSDRAVAPSKANHLDASDDESPVGIPSAVFSYPYSAAAKLKSKYSVSELNRRGQTAPQFFLAGGAAETDEDAGLTAAEKGTALHRMLEMMDFREAYANRAEIEWFEGFVCKLKESGVISDEEAASVEPRMLKMFAESGLAKRAAASDFLMKEAPFNMKIRLREALDLAKGHEAVCGLAAAASGDEGGEEIFIQGIVDCLFREKEGLVVADYKSGRFDTSDFDAEAERIRAAYGFQLRLYGKAIEMIFGEPVKESVFYMTNAGVTIITKA